MENSGSRRVVTLVVLAVIAVLLACAYFLHTRLQSAPVNSSEIAFSDLSLYDQDFSAHCSFTSSGKSFRKYDHAIAGDTLYLTIYGGLVTSSYPDGDFTIWIQDDLQEVEKVILKSGEKEELIFER